MLIFGKMSVGVLRMATGAENENQQGKDDESIGPFERDLDYPHIISALPRVTPLPRASSAPVQPRTEISEQVYLPQSFRGRAAICVWRASVLTHRQGVDTTYVLN